MSLRAGYCVSAPVTRPRVWRRQGRDLGRAHVICCCAAESHPAPPPLQEQEHQVQRVGSAVRVPLGVECLEFLHTHNSEWFKKIKVKNFLYILVMFSPDFFFYGRKDTSCTPAAFGRTILMFTSGMTAHHKFGWKYKLFEAIWPQKYDNEKENRARFSHRYHKSPD